MTSSKSTSRIREGFLLWYLAFFVAKGLNFVLPSVSIFHYLLVLCNMVYVPGMMYVAGIDIGRILREDETPEKILRKRALIFFGFYFCIGLVTEVLLKHRALFATVKDLMALLRMPSFGNILDIADDRTGRSCNYTYFLRERRNALLIDFGKHSHILELFLQS